MNGAETEGGLGGRIVELLSYGSDRADLLYLVAVGLGAPAAALVGLTVAAALGGGEVAAGGSGLAAGTLLFVATIVVFEAGWYTGYGGE